MDNFLNNSYGSNTNFLSSFCQNNGLDINKLILIILILTDRLQIESIAVFPNDFTVTLGTFRIV